MDPTTLINFICMFPELNDLELKEIEEGATTISPPSPTINPRFRGKLKLLDIEDSDGISVIAPLLHLLMTFRDVCVGDCMFGMPRLVRDLFGVCNKMVKKVEFLNVSMSLFHVHNLFTGD